MKTKIFWFSGTGNSLTVARDLAAALQDTELIPIAQAVKQPPQVEADAIGIVFPVYMWGPPLIVADFCRRLEAKPSTFCFAVATCGGSAGSTLPMAGELLKQRGLTLSLGYVLKMPGNYTPLYGAPAAATQQKFFDKERQRIPEMAAGIAARRTGAVEGGTFLSAILSKVVYRMGSRQIRGGDVKFFADDKCNGCEVCRKVCPVADIAIKEHRPTWLHHCEQCMACLQWCPQEAIQCGKRTATRRRYRHPGVTVKDFILSGSA